MTKLCIKIYHFFRNNRTFFWSSMIVLFIGFGYYASQIHLEEDLNKLLPSSKDENGNTKLAFSNLKIKDKTFLLFEGVNNVSTESIIKTCDDFIDSLNCKNIKNNTTEKLYDNIFYSLSDDLFPDVIDYFYNHFPSYIDTCLYSKLDTMLTYQHMSRQMEKNSKALHSPLGSMYPELIQIDPIGIRELLLQQFKTLSSNSNGGYKIIDGHFFVPDSTVCVAFITPSYSSTNTGQGAELFRTINGLIEKFNSISPDIKICYHGTPASGFYNASQIKSDLKSTITASLILVLIILVVCFRNYNTIPLLILPVTFGVVFGLAVMYFIKGEFSLLSLGIGAVVLGVAFSYVLHILTHYKYVSNPEKVLTDQVRPISLGCITTIGSFMGLMFVRTELLRDFGLFASLSIIGTTIFSFIYLPQLLDQNKNKINKKAFSIIEKANNYPYDKNKVLVISSIIIILICSGYYITGGTRFDANMHDLGYRADITSYSENLLRNKTYTGDKQKYFASSGKTMEEAINNFGVLDYKLDSLKKEGLVKDYTRTNLLFIPQNIQEERINAWKNYWTSEKLQLVKKLIDETASEAGIRPEAFNTFFNSVKAEYKPDALYESDIIPEGYLSTLMEQSYNGDYLCFTSVRCSNDSTGNKQSDYNKICNTIASQPNLLVLDTYYYTTDTLEQLNNDFNVLQWISMLFVFIVLLLNFRGNIRYTLVSFMPILLSWIIVLGTMVIFNKQFNLVNIIISTFIFGIGVDYSIFIMDGLLNNKQNLNLLKYHKTAIFFSFLILVITVSSMLFAKHPAIQSVGFCTLIGLVSSVLLSYIIQPAIFRMIKSKKQQ